MLFRSGLGGASSQVRPLRPRQLALLRGNLPQEKISLFRKKAISFFFTHQNKPFCHLYKRTTLGADCFRAKYGRYTCFQQRKTTILLTEEELIENCRKGKRKAQRELYDRFAPKMFGLCRRYVKNKQNAEDVLMQGFMKVYDKLGTFQSKGSFEGWIRRIMVNESLMFLRKQHDFTVSTEVSELPVRVVTLNAEDDLVAQDILNLLEQLPTGYRTVFNLYVLEGYKHREIAEELGISINTSKSQLILARKRLREMLEQNRYPGIQHRGD